RASFRKRNYHCACRYSSGLFKQTTVTCLKGNRCFKIGRRLVTSKRFEPAIADRKNRTGAHPKYVCRKRCHQAPIGPGQQPSGRFEKANTKRGNPKCAYRE